LEIAELLELQLGTVKMNRVKSLKDDLFDFCNRTTIAGLQHAGDRSKSWLYRLCWSVIVILAFVLAGISIWNSMAGKKALFQ
jgi:hypothetical protein